jgi:hypothetical protein
MAAHLALFDAKKSDSSASPAGGAGPITLAQLRAKKPTTSPSNGAPQTVVAATTGGGGGAAAELHAEASANQSNSAVRAGDRVLGNFADSNDWHPARVLKKHPSARPLCPTRAVGSDVLLCVRRHL